MAYSRFMTKVRKQARNEQCLETRCYLDTLREGTVAMVKDGVSAQEYDELMATAAQREALETGQGRTGQYQN